MTSAAPFPPMRKDEVTTVSGDDAARINSHCLEMQARALAAEAALEKMRQKINTPELYDFSMGVMLEAAHQRERWGTEQDGGKTDADWFWLIGYLAGKALHNPPNEMTPLDAKLHRIVTVAAAAANWHAALLGQTDMRPGIEPPAALTTQGGGE